MKVRITGTVNIGTEEVGIEVEGDMGEPPIKVAEAYIVARDKVLDKKEEQ